MSAPTLLHPNADLTPGSAVHHHDPEMVAAGFCGVYVQHIEPARDFMTVWLEDGERIDVVAADWRAGVWEATR